MILNHMSRRGRLTATLILILFMFTGCKTCECLGGDRSVISHDRQHRPGSLFYKPSIHSASYRITLPAGCRFECFCVSNTNRYDFRYHDAIFYVSDDFCQFIQSSNSTVYNDLLKQYELLERGDSISCPIKGVVYESGATKDGYWKYQLIYDLSKQSPTYFIYDHLYVGYYNAKPQDTATLNSCIMSTVLVEN